MTGSVRRVATLPFDHARRATSALLDNGGARVLVVKGAPEQVLANCAVVPQAAHRTLDALFAQGRRVVAVASKPAPDLTAITAADESGLALDGFLVFADEPKAAARDSAGAVGGARHRGQGRHRRQPASRRKSLCQAGFDLEGHDHRR